MIVTDKPLSSLIDDDIAVTGDVEACSICGITGDSRKVRAGYLFAARSGTHAEGHKFVQHAIEQGAVAVLVESDASIENAPADLVILRSRDTRRSLALMAARFYETQPETVVGITGTSGKTSIASFLRQIWSYEGMPAATIGTVGIISPTRNEYGSLTTPDPVDLQQVLSELAGEGVTHTALEASSHGLQQRRLDGVNFAAAGFVNLGRDHLDYHETVEEYFAAKMRLFDELVEAEKPAVIFADDPFSQAAVDHATSAGLTVRTVGRNGNFIRLNSIERDGFRQILHVNFGPDFGENDVQIKLPLLGEFQVSNALVAAGLALSTGGSIPEVCAGLERLKGAPGRIEYVGEKPNGAMIFVDYAHKVEALENVLAALRPYADGRLIVVFGCGGDRDQGKRSLMGKIAQDGADYVIVTDDNPRTESPETIRKAILAEAPDAIEIADRGEAIVHALKIARGSDVVVVAGKGHETGQIVGAEVLPFSDHEVVAKALADLA